MKDIQAQLGTPRRIDGAEALSLRPGLVVPRGATSLAGTRPVAVRGRAGRGDRAFAGLVTACVLVVLAVFSGIFLVLVDGALPAIRLFGLGFLVTSGWDPVKLQFGALPFIVGTLVVAVSAMGIAGCIGFLTAVCVTEFIPRWMREPVAYLIELLAFIPSVVYGLFGLLVLAPALQRSVQPWLIEHVGSFIPFFDGAPYGVGYMTAILILAIMLLPLIVALSREALLLVPTSQREAMYALGATHWEVVFGAVVPYARNGIFGAMILALGRALGETMAVAMTIGGGFRLPGSLMDQGYTLASVIANEFNEVSSDTYLSALIYCGLLLFILTIGVNVLAFVILRRLAGTHGIAVKG